MLSKKFRCFQYAHPSGRVSRVLACVRSLMLRFFSICHICFELPFFFDRNKRIFLSKGFLASKKKFFKKNEAFFAK